ncbi:MAG: Gfo/Idh/MocA family protein, partial [Candidatus Hodarchaeota archaeon]
MKILLIGLGSIGQRHAKNLKMLGIHDLIAFRSRKENLGFCEKNSIKQYWSLDSAIKEHPDIVFITNPTSLHIPIALKIVKQLNSHLFFEKPLSNSFEGIKELQRLINEKKIITMVGYNMRFHPLLKKIKEFIKNGQLGEIIAYRSIWGEYLPDWHPWEDYKKSYSARDDLGGGTLLTLSHDIDTAIWLFGNIEETNGFLSDKRVLDTTTDECSIITTKHKNGIIGSLFFDYLQDPPKRSLEIVASKGNIHWDYYSGKITIINKKKRSSITYLTPKDYERNKMFL